MREDLRMQLRSHVFGFAALTLVVFAGACGGDDAAITYHGAVAPLMRDHCVACHQADGIGPFALTNFNEVAAYADAIATVTKARMMPPSPIDASGKCQTFQGARWMTDAEIDVLQRWANAGAPEGTAPEQALALPAVDTLNDATVVLEMGAPYTPKSTNADFPNDDYRCFVMENPSAATAFMQGFEIFPGNPSEVHHMLLFSIVDQQGEDEVRALDSGEGWECFSSPFDSHSNFIAAWAPGTNVMRYPKDTGLYVAGGRPFVMQIHYNLLAGARPDLTSVALKTVPTVANEAAVAPIAKPETLQLAPGERDVHSGFSLPLVGISDDLLVHGVFPHMHTLGTTLNLSVRPIGADVGSPDEECLVDVWRWDFHWQQFAMYQEPIVLRASDSVTIDCGYDTTGRNQPITWGEGTQDEMCLAFVYVTRVSGGALAGLLP